MLSGEDRQRIEAEERFRREVRNEINPPTRHDWKAALFAGDNVKWIASTLLIPITVFVWGQIDKAKHQASLDQELKINTTRQDVGQLTALLPGLSSDDERQRSLALVVLSQLVSSRTAADPLNAAYNQIRKQVDQDRNSDDPATKARAAKTDASLILGSNGRQAPDAPPSAQDLAQAPVVSTALIPAISSVKSSNFVYIQIYSDQQRALAKNLQAGLEASAVPVIGIENVVTTHGARVLASAQHGSADIRFFYAADKAAAASLVPLVEAAAPQYGRPVVRDLSASHGVAKPGTVEIWFPCGPKGTRCGG